MRERSRPIVQRLLERESAFCSGRCAAESEKRLADALFRVAVASLSPDPMLPRTFELP
ncbi:MAG: hypothetical protein QXO51_06675 [Halobacteria archaeon]